MLRNFDSVSHKNFCRKPGKGKYEYAIYLILFLVGSYVQVADFQRYIKFLFGGSHAPKGLKPRVIETLQKQKSRGIIDKIKREILPKRIPKARKLQHYAKRFPKAWKIIEENHQGENHKQGRYVSLYMFRPGLPKDFISKIKHETAEFFGFKSWHGGVVVPGRSFQDTLVNCRNSYAHGEKAGLPRSVYAKEKASDRNIGIWVQREDVEVQGLLDSVRIPGSLCKRTKKLLKKFAQKTHAEAGLWRAETKTYQPLKSGESLGKKQIPG